jgi:protein phosphatase
VLSLCIGSGHLSRNDIDRAVRSLCTGDRVVVCSDGLTGELSNAEIGAVLSQYPDDREAVDALVERALAAGGHDNVTVIVATA